MSVFSDLCMRARQLGAARLDFRVDLHERDEDGVCGDWICQVSIPGDHYLVRVARGRTGEESLRTLVEQFDAVKIVGS